MSDVEPVVDSPAEPVTGPIVARAGKYYRNTRYLMVAILLLYGVWSIYDGFVKWPEDNRKAILPVEQGGEGLEKGPHTNMDVFLNKALGVALPPLGITLLVWFLLQSRGTYTLDGDVLRVPGHPPVNLNEIIAVDKAKWDRKGIALVEYQTKAGKKGTIKLDDFVYERDPTDAIFKRIDDLLTSKVNSQKEQMRAAVMAPTTQRPNRNAPPSQF